MASTIPTDPFDGHSVLFSPFAPNLLAFVGGSNYGIAGAGGLIVFDHGPNGYHEIRRYGWKDVLYDVTWSEVDESVLVVASGDRNVVIFNITQDAPTAIMTGHTAEVSSVEWSLSRREQHLISSSWDKTIKLWDPVTCTCLMTLTGHTGLVYSSNWSPHIPSTVASVSGDGTLRLWDLSQSLNTLTVSEGGNEVLSCSWNKYQENILCSAGTDNTIKLWDIRQFTVPVLVMVGHTQSVRQVKFDPHTTTHLASSSYDFSVRLWDTSNPLHSLLQTISHHTEFTYSVDFSVHQRGLIADCSWDKTVKLYTPSALAPPPPPPPLS